MIDQDCLFLDFAIRARDAGHEVRWYRFNLFKAPRDGEGMGFKFVEDWRDHMTWARDGLIFCSTNERFMIDLDRYREFGFQIFGPTAASAKLEIDRAAGMEAFRAAGIDIPAHEEFDSFAAAEAFCWKSDRPWVFKPLGTETDKSLTYVSTDAADMCGWLARQAKIGKKLKGKCMLQEKIDMLAEVCVAAWCGPEGFLEDKWLVGFEHKKLMPGEKGPATGELGTVQQYVASEKLADDVLRPLEPILRTLGHRGNVDVNCGIDQSGKAWPFEFTCRPGWPQFYIQTAAHRGDPAQWMRDLLDGKDTLRVSRDVQIGVLCAHPEFPYTSVFEGAREIPIYGVEEVYDDLHCVSVMLGRGPQLKDGKVVDGPLYMTSGEYVLVATSLGKTVERARAKVYRIVDRIKFADMMYRIDIGEKVEKVLPKLHSFGYAKNVS